jgi:hypothetical protein
MDDPSEIVSTGMLVSDDVELTQTSTVKDCVAWSSPCSCGNVTVEVQGSNKEVEPYMGTISVF